MGEKTTIEESIKETPADRAFHLAEAIYPIEANSLNDPPTIKAKLITYKLSKLIQLARFQTDFLKAEDIKAAAIHFSDDYNDDQDYWQFTAEGIKGFLKWSKPREKELFD